MQFKRKNEIQIVVFKVETDKYTGFLMQYLNMNGILSLAGTSSPKKKASSAILSKTLRKISPKYMPEVNFSNICMK